MKKIKLFPKIFLFTFAMMLLISFIAHLLIFLIAPAQNVLVTNILVTNAGASTLSEVDMPRLITQTMLKTFPISILCCAAISALFSYFFSRGITTPILSLSKSANQMLKLEPDAKAIVPPEQLQHIFEPFYRPDLAHSQATGGNGLGLYIVQTILDKLRLKYQFVPMPNDRGMSFTIQF